MLLVFVGIVAAAVDALTPESDLRIPRFDAGYGSSAIRTGTSAYPREAVDGDGFLVRVARPARRIASMYWSIDEYLYAVVPPDHVVAVSESAYQHFSNAYPYAERFHPLIATDAESVIRLDPDLMLIANTEQSDFSRLVQAGGVPVYRMFTTFGTLDQIVETIRLIGYLTGEDQAAEKEMARFRAAIERARSLRPPGAPQPRILGLGGRYSYGSDTLFHDIVQTLGGINVGAEGGLKGYAGVNSEQILRWDPEWIVTGADQGKTKEALDLLLADPAIALTQAARNGRILVFENRVFLPMSPFTTLLVTGMAEAIYG
jgi:iron complex transport system substrate-binding protein